MRSLRGRETFSSLAVRNYRLYSFGQVVSVTGTWMQKVAQAWLVLEITHSGTMLGLATAIQQLPSLLLTPFAGVVTDRVDRRKLLLWTQCLSIVPAVLLGVLSLAGRATIGEVLTLALVLGCLDSIDKPSRLTFVMDMVGRQHLNNAVMLNSVVQNAGKVLGPAVAGVLIATVGLPETFFINAVSYIAVIMALQLMRRSEMTTSPPVARRRGQLREGLSYVWGTPSLRGPLILMTITGTVAYNFQVLLPLLAKQTFHGGPQLAGNLFTAMGVGAILGLLSLAGRHKVTQARLVKSALIFGAILAVVGLTPSPVTAVVTLALLGASSVTFRVIANTIVQVLSAPQMRGRVVALLIVAFNGTTPIGGPFIGWIGDRWGARAAFLVAAVTTAAAAVWLHLSGRRLLTRVEPADAGERSLVGEAVGPDEPEHSAVP